MKAAQCAYSLQNDLGEWIQQLLVSGCGRTVHFIHIHMCVFNHVRVHVEIREERHKNPGEGQGSAS